MLVTCPHFDLYTQLSKDYNATLYWEEQSSSTHLSTEKKHCNLSPTGCMFYALFWTLFDHNTLYPRIEAESLLKLAKQHREAERAAEKERNEESMVLERLQQRMRELKINLGGKIRQLEVELKKSEAGKVLLREKLELEIKTTRRELELQRKLSKKYREIH